MRILVVDNNHMSRVSLVNFLEEYQDHAIVNASNGEEALQLFQNEDFQLIITDISLPKMNGIELLKSIKADAKGKNTEVVVITGIGDIDKGIEALRLDAMNYILKPVRNKELAVVIAKMLHHHNIKKENKLLKEDMLQYKSSGINTQSQSSQFQPEFGNLVTQEEFCFASPQMERIVEQCRMLHKDREVPVLIQGDTGTGKEVVCHMIHFDIDKKINQPLITLNCSAISPALFESELFGYEEGAFTGARQKGAPGKLEMANGGTLFLDEIGDIPSELQPKLLRVMQDKKFYKVGGQKEVYADVRFIVATNHDLSQKVKEGLFRKDLFYRINTYPILVPALKDRQEDIIPMAEMFLAAFNSRKKKHFKGFTAEAKKKLLNYPWPGNVRELKNVIARVILVFDEIYVKKDHLDILQNEQTALAAKSAEKFVINFDDDFDYQQIKLDFYTTVLSLFDGNITQASRYLNVARNTFKKKMNTNLSSKKI